MPLLLIVLLIAVPVAEIWVIIQVGEAIGVLPTIALLIADSVLGSLLIRSQGRAAWRRLRAAIAAHRVPAAETADGALIVLGGALMLAPGFLTDAVGMLLIAPPTRAVARRTLGRRIPFVGSFVGRDPGATRARETRGRPYDVDGTATDLDAPQLP